MKKIFNNEKIGICDSGQGGLSIFNELIKKIPNENYLYLADTLNLPYGEKTQDELIKIVKKVFDFFEKQKVKALVIACNTTCAYAYDVLKNNYDFKIYPIIQDFCLNFDCSKVKKIGIFSTCVTANSHIYQKLLKKKNSKLEIIETGCSGWVEIVENKTFNKKKSLDLIKKYCEPMKKHTPEKIILACTHYPFLTDNLLKYFDKEILINPAKDFVETIFNDFEKNNLFSESQSQNLHFLTTGEIKNLNHYFEFIKI